MYADDKVLMALRKRLPKNLEEKGLKINAKKEVMRFKRGRRRMGNVRCKRKNEMNNGESVKNKEKMIHQERKDENDDIP